MSHTIITSIFLLLSTALSAQIVPDSALTQVVAYWELGEKQTYKVTDIRTRSRLGQVQTTDTTRYEFTVEVIDSNYNGYRLSVNYAYLEIASDNDLMQQLAAMPYKAQPVVKTDELGMFLEIDNWESVRDDVYTMLDSLAKVMADVPNVGTLLQPIRQVYSTQTAIETSAMQDIQLLLTLHGGAYGHQDTLQEVLQVANIYNPAAPFNADYQLYIDTVNYDFSTTTFIINQIVDQNQLTEAVHSFLVEMTRNAGQPEPSIESLGSISNELFIEQEIHDSGWPLEVYSEKRISTQGIMQVESRHLLLK